MYGRICQFWYNNGRTDDFGLPLTEQGNLQTERGMRQGQLFERQVLEWHYDMAFPYDVLLRRLGDERLIQLGRPWQYGGQQAMANCTFRSETGYNFCNPFRSVWFSRGIQEIADPAQRSLALYGIPITSVQTEKNLDGFTVPTQWFERARFEYYQENAGTIYEVQLGRLGAESQPDVNIMAIVPLALTTEQSIKDAIKGIPLELASDRVAIYGLENAGAALVLVPRAEPFDTLVLQSRDQDLPLGGLAVVQQIYSKLSPDTYFVALSPDNEQIFLRSTTKELPFPAIIRELPVPTQRPVAFVAGDELCWAQGRVAICIAPGTGENPYNRYRNKLEAAATELKIELDVLAFDLAVPLTNGERQLEECVRTIRSDRGNYQSCGATIIGVPAVFDGAFPPPIDDSRLVAIGMVKLLADLQDDVFRDPALTELVSDIPAGNYAVFEVQAGGSDAGPHPTSVLLAGLNADTDPKSNSYYLPALSGSRIVGKLIRGNGPAEPIEMASGISMYMRGRCFFNVGSCAWAR
jgi:hypothetical protein